MLRSWNVFFLAGMFAFIGCGTARDSSAPFSSMDMRTGEGFEESAKKATVARLTALQGSLAGLQARAVNTYNATKRTTFILSYEVAFFDVGIFLEATCVLNNPQEHDSVSVKTQMTLAPQGNGSYRVQDRLYAPDRTVSVDEDGRTIERVCRIPDDLMSGEVRVADFGTRVSLQGKDSVLVFSKIPEKDAKSK